MVRVADPRRRVRYRTRVRKRRKNTKKRLVLILAGSGLILLVGAVTLVSASTVQNRLEEARSAMAQGRTALVDGDVAKAQGAFEAARSAFTRARGSYRNPIFLGIGYLPLIGRSPDTVSSLISAGTNVSDAGITIAEAAQELPGGIAGLAPDNGALPLEDMQAMAPALVRARELLDEASATLEAAPGWLILGPVDEARDDLAKELAAARRTVTAAAAATRSIPSFLGADGPRTYFVAAQNPAELRGTGGFIGAYAILVADQGRLDFGPFRTIQPLQDVEVDQIEPPNPDYASRYDNFGGAGFWRNINMTPDFPSAASAIERLYEVSEGESLDGVIAADPFALAEMLETTGPVLVPGTDREIDAESVVPYVTNEAYSDITDSNQRKRLLGEVAREVLGRLLAGAADPAAGGRALVEAAAGGHLLLHSTDPEVQADFEKAGVSGSLPTQGDLLAVSLNNAAANKVDYYLEEQVDYSVTLGAEGSASARASISLTNDAPAAGVPAYVIGPYNETFEPGQNFMLLSAFCARACTLDSFTRDGARADVLIDEELGQPVFSTVVDLASGESQDLEFDWTMQRAWSGDDGQGVYRLTVRPQPTIRPTALHLDVQVPEGMRIGSASEGMKISGGRASWQGEVVGETVFEVRFERPTLQRVWHGVLEFLGRPVVRF